VGALFASSPRPAAKRRPSPGTPTPAPARVAMSFLDDDESSTAPVSTRPARRSAGVKFDAELDMTELDDRERPGPTWSAKGRELGRSHLILRTRRMCHLNRRVLVAVHLIDDRPVPLFGRVLNCEYDGDGLYKVDLELMRVPDRPEIAAWLDSLG
jgi:hypothetical protein